MADEIHKRTLYHGNDFLKRFERLKVEYEGAGEAVRFGKLKEFLMGEGKRTIAPLARS